MGGAAKETPYPTGLSPYGDRRFQHRRARAQWPVSVRQGVAAAVPAIDHQMESTDAAADEVQRAGAGATGGTCDGAGGLGFASLPSQQPRRWSSRLDGPPILGLDSVAWSLQGRLNRVEESTDFCACIVRALTPFDCDRQQVRSSVAPELGRFIVGEPSNCVCHDSNSGKLSANWERVD